MAGSAEASPTVEWPEFRAGQPVSPTVAAIVLVSSS